MTHRLEIVFALLLLFFSIALPKTGWAAKVSIGLVNNFSETNESTANPFSAYFRNGVNLAFKHNKKRLLKKNIEVNLVEFDHGRETINVLGAARKAAKSDVVAVIGNPLSSYALISASIYIDAQLPMVTPGATANRLNSFKRYIHRPCFDNRYMARQLAKLAIAKFKSKKILAIVAQDCAYCTDFYSMFREEFLKSQASKIKLIKVLRATKDFSPHLPIIKAFDPDVIFVPNQDILSPLILKYLVSNGIKKPFIAGDSWGNISRLLYKIAKGLDFEGYAISHWHIDDKSQASKTFIAQYLKEFGHLPTEDSVLSYDASLYLIEALLRADKPTRLAVEEAFQNLRFFNGITGKITFDNELKVKKKMFIIKVNSSQARFDLDSVIFP